MSKDRRRRAPTLAGAGPLGPSASPPALGSFDDSMCDRRSLASIASGIYEEISELPPPAEPEALYCKMTHTLPEGVFKAPQPEPAYESVCEGRPPPLPPRGPPLGLAAMRPRTAHTLPKLDKRQPFSVFRKRLKSDSRIASPKSETAKDKDVEPKKKKFEFAPTRDIFKSFKVSRKMKGLKITGAPLAKGEAKSCDCLDAPLSPRPSPAAPGAPSRGARSEECLETSRFLDSFDADLSLELPDDALAALALPKELVDLLLGHDHLSKLRLRENQTESEYMPMSPIAPAPIEHHYIVMSPRPNLA